VSYGAVLGDKSTMFISDLILRMLDRIVTHLGVSCTVFFLTCFVICGCVCVCVCVCVGFVTCGCFGNTSMCTCIYCVLYCLYCVFVLIHLGVFILICFVCTGVRTAATE
jgi:hypothetical protein